MHPHTKNAPFRTSTTALIRPLAAAWPFGPASGVSGHLTENVAATDWAFVPAAARASEHAPVFREAAAAWLLASAHPPTEMRIAVGLDDAGRLIRSPFCWTLLPGTSQSTGVMEGATIRIDRNAVVGPFAAFDNFSAALFAAGWESLTRIERSAGRAPTIIVSSRSDI